MSPFAQDTQIKALMVRATACNARIEAQKVGAANAALMGRQSDAYGTINAEAEKLEVIAQDLQAMAESS